MQHSQFPTLVAFSVRYAYKFGMNTLCMVLSSTLSLLPPRDTRCVRMTNNTCSGTRTHDPNRSGATRLPTRPPGRPVRLHATHPAPSVGYTISGISSWLVVAHCTRPSAVRRRGWLGMTGAKSFHGAQIQTSGVISQAHKSRPRPNKGDASPHC